ARVREVGRLIRGDYSTNRARIDGVKSSALAPQRRRPQRSKWIARPDRSPPQKKCSVARKIDAVRGHFPVSADLVRSRGEADGESPDELELKIVACERGYRRVERLRRRRRLHALVVRLTRGQDLERASPSAAPDAHVIGLHSRELSR